MPLGGSRRSLLSHLRGLFITRPREARTARPDFWGSPWWWNGRPAALRSDSTRGESRWGGASIPIRLTVDSQTAPWHRILQNLAAAHFSPTPLGGEKTINFQVEIPPWFHSKQRPDSCSRFIYFNCILMAFMITPSAVSYETITSRWLILQVVYSSSSETLSWIFFCPPDSLLAGPSSVQWGEGDSSYSFATVLCFSWDLNRRLRCRTGWRFKGGEAGAWSSLRSCTVRKPCATTKTLSRQQKNLTCTL